MSLYRNGNVTKLGLTEFCDYFNNDVEIDYYKDDWKEEYFYKTVGREAWDNREVRFKKPSDAVSVFSDFFEDNPQRILYEYGFEDVYDEDSLRSYYEQAKDWIEAVCTDLYDTDTYNIILAIINPEILYDDFKCSPAFVRRAKCAYKRVWDCCYSIEQAFYLANKRWNETKDKGYWDYFYICIGDRILKDFVKEYEDEKKREAQKETPRERILRTHGIDISTPPRYDGIGVSPICPMTSEEMDRLTYDGYQSFLVANNID